MTWIIPAWIGCAVFVLTCGLGMALLPPQHRPDPNPDPEGHHREQDQSPITEHQITDLRATAEAMRRAS